jgi:hypothetical protein
MQPNLPICHVLNKSSIGLPALSPDDLLQQKGSVIKFHKCCERFYSHTPEIASEAQPCISNIPKFHIVNGMYKDINEEEDIGEEVEENHDGVLSSMYMDRSSLKFHTIISKFVFEGEKNQTAYPVPEYDILYPRVRKRK